MVKIVHLCVLCPIFAPLAVKRVRIEPQRTASSRLRDANLVKCRLALPNHEIALNIQHDAQTLST